MASDLKCSSKSFERQGQLEKDKPFTLFPYQIQSPKLTSFLQSKINFAQMENHPQVSHLQRGKVRMKSVRKFHAAFVPDGRVLVSHIRDEKKNMETHGSSEGEYQSLYARSMEVWGEIHTSRQRPHTFALFMHRGDLARVLAKCRENTQTESGDRSVWGRMPFKRSQFLGHVSIRRARATPRSKGAPANTFAKWELELKFAAQLGLLKGGLWIFLLRMINVKDWCLKICLLIWLKSTWREADGENVQKLDERLFLEPIIYANNNFAARCPKKSKSSPQTGAHNLLK